MIQAVIFDWGRTLYDTENGKLFPDSTEVLETLARRYVLAIVSLDTKGVEAERRKIITQADIERHFKLILFGPADKGALYEDALARLSLSPADVVIVDDRLERGVQWGRTHGAVTVWYRGSGSPTQTADDPSLVPTYTVTSLSEMVPLLTRGV